MGTKTEKVMIKKHLVRPFVSAKGEPSNWIQIKKSTTNNREMNPTTEEREYISDEQATTEVTGYKPSASYDLTMFKGEEDFGFFYTLQKNRPVGAAAHFDLLEVNIFDSVTTTEPEAGEKTYYYAEKTDATIAVNSMNSVDSVMSVAIYENGTPIKGYVEITEGKPTFTAGEMPVGA